jgi:hypothetical protein
MTCRRELLLGCALVSAVLGGAPTAAQPPAASPEPFPASSPAVSAPAETATAPPATAAPATVAPQAPAQNGEPVVRRVLSDRPSHPNRAGLGDRIVVVVERLDRLLAEAENGCAGIVLFLDGVPISGVPPVSCNESDSAVRFELDRNDDSDRAWHSLLGEPPGLQRRIRVSVGANATSSVRTEVLDFELEIVPAVPFGLYLAALVVTFALLVHFSRTTSLLRDPHAVPPAGRQAPYSLARFQLAFWSFLVVTAYLFLWMVTEELDTITGSVLALLGIGAGTALSSSVIAAGKGTAATVTTGSRGFLLDLLTDSGGVSLYRFQMFIWTLVLGIIFVVSIYQKLDMPEFSATLLGLMGISSGTFLGAKFPEDRTKG